jgi:hypothetical protein
MVHDHSFAPQQHADPTPLGDCMQSPVSQWIAKPPPFAGYRLHLFANFWIIRRLIAPDGLGIDTPLGILLRNTLPGSEQACTHDVARYHDPASPCVLQPAAHSVSSVLSQQILQHNIVQHGICQQALQFSVLIFQRFKAVGLRDIHSPILRFELVERRWTETMPAAHLCSRHPSFLFLNHPNNLCLSKTALSHLFAPSKG